MDIEEIDNIPSNLGSGRRNRPSEYEEINASLKAMNGLPLKIIYHDKEKWKGITRFIYACATESYKFRIISDLPNNTIFVEKINRKETKNV